MTLRDEALNLIHSGVGEPGHRAIALAILHLADVLGRGDAEEGR